MQADLDLVAAAKKPARDVLRDLGSNSSGLSTAEAQATAAAGRTERDPKPRRASYRAVLSGLSVGLGFVSEYRSARAVEALHSQLRHTSERAPRRQGCVRRVTGDVVRIGVGDVVPADLCLLEANELECDESVLTGESAPAEKSRHSRARSASPACRSGSSA